MSKMEGLFRIDVDTLNAGGFAPDVLNMALHWGILVPVEKCEHGKIDPHKFRLLCYHFDEETCRKACWCEGAGLENKT